MAEVETAEVKLVSVMNRGKRTYEMKDASGQLVKHAPGDVRQYTEEQAAKVLAYLDLVDISKLPGQVNLAKIQEENAKLRKENAELRAQVESLKIPTAEGEDAQPRRRGK